MKKAANDSYGYTEDPIVSSDIIGMNYGSLFDATQTKVIGKGEKQMGKVVAWYDNEMSYTAQLIKTLKYFVKLVKQNYKYKNLTFILEIGVRFIFISKNYYFLKYMDNKIIFGIDVQYIGLIENLIGKSFISIRAKALYSLL